MGRLVAIVYSAALVAVFSLGSCHPRPPAPDYSARIGVAVQLPDRVCLAIYNSKLLPSSTFTLLAASNPPYTARAFVLTRNAQYCPGTKAQPKLSNYNLQINAGSVESDWPLVAVEARVPSVDAAHSFHSCGTKTGIHLTAWDGAKPLEGHRLWHQFYARAGGDVATECTLPETAE